MAVEWALLLLLATLWGSSYTFIRVGVETIPPVTFIALRTLIASVLLLAVLALRGMRLPRDLPTWRNFLMQACLNSVLPFTLIAWAEMHVHAGTAVILNSTTPIFTFLLTALITRHEAATARKLFGVIVGLLGISLVIGLDALRGTGDDMLAQLAIVFATISYAGAAIWSRAFKGMDFLLPAAGSMVCGAMILVPLSLLVDRPWTLTPSTDSLLALLCLSVFSTALGFVIFFRLVHTLGSVGVTSQAYLRVPIGVGIGVVFLGEALSSTTWIGFVCVIVGVVAMTVQPKARVAVL